MLQNCTQVGCWPTDFDRSSPIQFGWKQKDTECVLDNAHLPPKYEWREFGLIIRCTKTWCHKQHLKRDNLQSYSIGNKVVFFEWFICPWFRYSWPFSFDHFLAQARSRMCRKSFQKCILLDFFFFFCTALIEYTSTYVIRLRIQDEVNREQMTVAFFNSDRKFAFASRCKSILLTQRCAAKMIHFQKFFVGNRDFFHSIGHWSCSRALRSQIHLFGVVPSCLFLNYFFVCN